MPRASVREDIWVQERNLNATPCSCQVDTRIPVHLTDLTSGSSALFHRFENWDSDDRNALLRCHRELVVGSGSWNPGPLRTMYSALHCRFRHCVSLPQSPAQRSASTQLLSVSKAIYKHLRDKSQKYLRSDSVGIICRKARGCQGS